MPLNDEDFIGVLNGGQNADMVRATVVRDGKKAERAIEPARQAALKAWDAWRNFDVFKVRDARTGEMKTVFQPSHPAKQNTGVVYEQSRDEKGNLVMIEVLRTNLSGNDESYPELAKLREVAEAADRNVLDLQDAIDIMRAMAPMTINRARR